MPVVPAGLTKARASGLALGLLAAAALGATPAVDAQERAEVALASQAEAALQPGPPPANFTVVGVVIGPEKSFVFLREPALTQNSVVSVTLGDSVGPYRVSEIESDRVMLESQGRTYALLFSRQGGGSGATVASTPTSASGGGGIQVEVPSGAGRAQVQTESTGRSPGSGKGQGKAASRGAAPEAAAPATTATGTQGSGESELTTERAGRKSATSREASGSKDAAMSPEARRAQVEARIKEALEQASARGSQNRVTAPSELQKTFGVSPAK